MTKLEKLSEKSLLFLVWKQRKVINSLARQIKKLLAERKQVEELERELHFAQYKVKSIEEAQEKWFNSYEQIMKQRNEAIREVAYLKGRLEEREVKNG